MRGPPPPSWTGVLTLTDPPQERPSPKQARASNLRRFGPLLLAVLAFLVFRAVTSDDGARDVTPGQCVTADPATDVRVVDCSDASALGKVVFVQRESFTDDASVRRTCAAHGSAR